VSAVNNICDLAAELGIDTGEMRWMDYARCAETDSEIFFPEKGDSTKPAKKVCRWCDVREECLAYAIAHPSICRHGIWGGTSERERHAMRQEQKGRAA
jgi:WhiB family redox-sensing transcriptional regulator